MEKCFFHFTYALTGYSMCNTYNYPLEHICVCLRLCDEWSEKTIFFHLQEKKSLLEVFQLISFNICSLRNCRMEVFRATRRHNYAMVNGTRQVLDAARVHVRLTTPRRRHISDEER